MIKSLYSIRANFLLRFVLIVAAIGLSAAYLLKIRWPTWIDHVLRAMLLDLSSNQIWRGDFYPRWLMEANAGLGSPVMLFQPALSFYLALPLELLKPVDPFGLWRLLIVNLCYVFIGGFGYYYWLREHFGKTRAEYGAILFLVYPVLFAWILSGNSAGICTASIIPFLMLAAKKTADNPSKNAPLYALAQALLTLSHLPTVLIFSAIPALYALVYAAKEKRFKVMLYLITAGSIGLALSSIYWLPVFVNKDFILYHFFTIGNVDYNAHFPRIIKHPLMFTGFYFLGLANLCYLIIPFIICCIYVRKKNPFAEHRQLVSFFLIVYFIGIFMVFPSSKFLWENLTILRNLQFPGRFNILLFISIIFIVTCWFHKIVSYNLFYTLSLTICVMIFLFNCNYQYSGQLNRFWANVYYNKLIPQNPHMTIWMQKAGIRDSMNPPKRFLNVPPSRLINGEAEIVDIAQDTRSISFKARVTSPNALVVLKRYYYPGWIVPEDMPSGIAIREYDALLAINLPQGEYEVTIKQPWFPGEKLGVLISSAGLIIICGWIILARRFRNRIDKKTEKKI